MLRAEFTTAREASSLDPHDPFTPPASVTRVAIGNVSRAADGRVVVSELSLEGDTLADDAEAELAIAALTDADAAALLPDLLTVARTFHVDLRLVRDPSAPMLWAVWYAFALKDAFGAETFDWDIAGAGATVHAAMRDAEETMSAWRETGR